MRLCEAGSFRKGMIMYDLVRVENLVKEYPGFTLDRVSLSVAAGCVTGFIGSNGAGKTTTIKSILGLVHPDGGNIALFGEPVCRFDTDAAFSSYAEENARDIGALSARSGSHASGGARCASEARMSSGSRDANEVHGMGRLLDANVTHASDSACDAGDARGAGGVRNAGGSRGASGSRSAGGSGGSRTAGASSAPTVHDAALARAKARMGVVFDTCPFPNESRVSDVECVGRYAFPTWDRGVFAHYASRFDLDAKRKVKDLSRGMGMKLQLAFALAHAPELLILDEVTAGLDPMARDETLDILREFMRDERHGILISSHITSDLEKIADYVVCIDEGREAFSCTVDDICDQAGVVRCGSEQAERIVDGGVFPADSLRVMRSAYSCEVLVPDRAILARRFPQVACERVDIESYMRLMLKGEPR